MVEIIIEGTAMERHPVEAGVPQGSPVSPIFSAIYTSGLLEWVQDYLSENLSLSLVDDLGSFATGSDITQVLSIIKIYAATSIEWASRRGLQFMSEKPEAALFSQRQGQWKQLRPKLTAMITVGTRVIRLNTLATR